MQVNVQSLTNKMHNLETYVSVKNIDLVCISEHWLNKHNVNLYNLSGFHTVNAYCRTNRIHGGTSIMCASKYKCEPLEDLAQHSVEMDCEISACYVSNLNIVVVSLYRSPQGDIDTFLITLENALTYVVSKYKSDIRVIVAGDFNIDFNKHYSKRQSTLDLMSRFGLHQTVYSNTHHHNNVWTCIDNIFTDFEQYNIESLPAVLSDHSEQIISLSINRHKPSKEKYYTRKFTAFKIQQFCNLLANEDWAEVFALENINTKFNTFLKIFTFNIEETFPLRLIIPKMKPIPMNAEHNQMLETLNLLYDAYKQTQDESIKQTYTKYKQTYNKALESARQQLNLDKIRLNRNKQHILWSIINKESGRQHRHMPEHSPSADEFNCFFANLASNLHARLGNSNRTPESLINNTQTTGKSFFLSPVSTSEVELCIYGLKSSNSLDVYNINTKLVKNTRHLIAEPLTHIINCCFEAGIFPDSMKVARVTPIYKKGNIKEPTNYRPISVLPIFSKVMEKLLLRRFQNFAESNNIINKHQFGFRKGLNTPDAVEE